MVKERNFPAGYFWKSAWEVGETIAKSFDAYSTINNIEL
jgi:hypothetical protein